MKGHHSSGSIKCSKYVIKTNTALAARRFDDANDDWDLPKPKFTKTGNYAM